MTVGRYQHAHAASTYSYTLALSRSPSPSSLPYSFLQPSYPLVLSPLHIPFLPSSYVSFFFLLGSDHYTAFCLSLSFFLFVTLFFPLFLPNMICLLFFSLIFTSDFSFSISYYWKLIFPPDFLVSSVFSPRTFHYLYRCIRRDSNYITAAMAPFIPNKKAVRSISLFYYISLFLS